jgi:hypothetical protein
LRTTNLDEINDEIFSKLEDVVGYLAGAWRETKEDSIVSKYHFLVNCLIDMGWKGSLDVEDNLPPDLMPKRYFEFIEAKRHQRSKNQGNS